MRRTLFSLLGAGTLLALAAMPAAAAHGGKPTVVVMQHLCKADIQSEQDFVKVEDQGVGGEAGGKGTLPGLVATVLACPTVFETSNTGTGGIASDPMNFNYRISDSAKNNYGLRGDAEFMPAELCESDVNLDANGDGKISKDVCLDVSMYGFTPVAEGSVTISQTTAPGNSRLGTVRFTPGSNDDKTLVSMADGVIKLDTGADTQVDNPPLPLAEFNDDVVVVHVYNFQNATQGGSGEMPDSAMQAPAAPVMPAWSPILIGIGTLLASGGLLVRRVLAGSR